MEAWQVDQSPPGTAEPLHQVNSPQRNRNQELLMENNTINSLIRCNGAKYIFQAVLYVALFPGPP